MSLKKQLTEIESKLKSLRLKLKQTEGILEKQDREAVERHRVSISNQARAIEDQRSSIEESKFSAGESEVVEVVEAWSLEIAQELAKAHKACADLTKCVKYIDDEAKAAEEAKRQANVMKFEKQLIAQKLEAGAKHKELSEKSSVSVKLPKLSITKFNGTPLDWVRFEGQFNAMVDCQDVPAITKFSHLKELVVPRIRSALDCLPFTDEGYERAIKYLREKYGYPSEVAGHYIIALLDLQPITERDVSKIHKFYEKLLFNVESLKTLGKLETIEGATFYVIVKKLEVLKAELATHVSGDWRNWSFSELLEALRKWTETNAVVKTEKRNPFKRPENGNSFHARDSNGCVFCQSSDHKPTNCDKVSTPEARKKYLADNKLCFNCAAGQHAASACKSKFSCQKCKKRHHTSICLQEAKDEPGMTSKVVPNTSCSTEDLRASPVIHPVVVVKVGGLKFRALLDSGASHSYVSARLVELTQASEVKRETRRIATLMGTSTSKFSLHDIRFESVEGNFGLNARVRKIERRELLNLENPHSDELIRNFAHLRDIKLIDVATKQKLPVHVILGANEYAKIRTAVQSRVGRPGEPIAEHTRFGWAIMAPGVDGCDVTGFLAANSSADYERLCALDILGLADSPSGDQGVVHQEFREQLTRDPQGGWYETGLPWKGNHAPFPPKQPHRKSSPVSVVG